jgi:superfamily I DNA and/or RNA helicase
LETDESLKSLKTEGRLDVLSIDACQGSEADYIIISTVRTNGFSKFVEDKQRLCVALSRAKQACFIIGDRRNMRKYPKSIWTKITDEFETLS